MKDFDDRLKGDHLEYIVHSTSFTRYPKKTLLSDGYYILDDAWFVVPELKAIKHERL